MVHDVATATLAVVEGVGTCPVRFVLRRTARKVWIGRAVALIAIAVLAVYLLLVGLDKADKVASAISVLVAVAAGFFLNMAFVIVSRTAMVTMPIMLAVFALLHLVILFM